jgi:hypothetical protein
MGQIDMKTNNEENQKVASEPSERSIQVVTFLVKLED